MKESEYKAIQKEARQLDETASRLEWELEEVIKELDQLGFNPPSEAYQHLHTLEASIARDEKKIQKAQRLYDKRWLGRISQTED